MPKTKNICHNTTKMQKPVEIETILNTFYEIYKNIKFALLKTQLSDGARDQTFKEFLNVFHQLNSASIV